MFFFYLRNLEGIGLKLEVDKCDGLDLMLFSLLFSVALNCILSIIALLVKLISIFV